MTETSPRRIPYRSLFLVLVLFLILVGLIQSHVLARGLRAVKLLPVTEPVTELYFTDPEALPKSYTAGQPQTIPITIRTVTDTEQTYTYSVAQTDGQDSQPAQLLNGTVAVSGHQTKTLPLRFIPTDKGSSSKITVTITTGSQRQTLHYWLTK